MIDNELDRCARLMEILYKGVDVVVCQEVEPGAPDNVVYVAGSKQVYQVQQGRTVKEARQAWMRCFLLDVLMQGNPNLTTHEPMPDDVWDEMTNREGAKVTRARFSFDQ